MRLFTLILTFFLLLAFSCKTKDERLKNADHFVITFRKGEDIEKITFTSQRVIEAFQQVLNSKPANRKCQPIGEIEFFAKDSAVFLAGFSLDKSCMQLMAGEKAWKLNYRAGMFLGEVLYSEKLAHE